MTVSTPVDSQRFEQLRRLTEISRALTYTTSLEQVLSLAVDRAAQLLDAPQAVLMLTDTEGLLHVRAAHGIDEARVREFREPLDETVLHRLQGLLGAVDENRFLGVPLVVRGEVTGLLAVVRGAGADTLTGADEWVLSALADQAAVAIENARLAGEVRQQRRNRVEQVREASEAREKALSTLSHDLRTPLTAIDSYAELMEMGIYGAVADPQREALGRIRVSGRHLLAVLENVMEMARLSVGVIRLDEQELEVSNVVREAMSIIQPSAEAKEQSLTLNTSTDILVHADAARLRQVMVNLLANAIKYTARQGAISIEVATTEREGKKYARIDVSDNGVGIPEDETEAIFEPYYRRDATASEPGVGLGLSISREVIRRMGGDITVISQEGKGSIFTAWLSLP
jgi:phosphoserine phosphatase RsbU/P